MESIGFTTPPSKRTYFLDYMGKVSIHRAYSKTMLRWLMAKLKFLRKPWFCALSIDKDGLTTRKQERVLINFSDPFSNQLVHTNGMPNNEIDSQKISHPLAVMDSVKELSVDADNSASELLPPGICYNEIIEVVSPTDYEKKCIGFMIDKGPSQPFALHVFQHESDAGLVKEIAETVKSFMSWFEKTTPSGCSCLISKNVKLEDLDSVRFEVMLLGKLQIKVEHSSSFNFVDEAVDKYHSLECQHAAAMEEFKMIENLSKESPDLPRANKLNEQQNISQSLIDGSREGAAEILLRKSSATWNQERRPSLDEGRQQRCNSMDMAAAAEMRQRTSRTRHCSEPATTAGMGFDKNKTRLFQVGRQAITLICTDQSVRNVEVPFTNIARHTKGVKHKDHFGVFAKDHSGHFQLHNHNAQKEDNKFKCFLFKCADEGVCDEIMQAMKQACHSCACGPDPMCTYHALCKRIHTMSGGNSDHSWIEKGTNLAAKCASNSLSEADQKRIKQKIEECYNDNPPESTYERLVVIMEMMRQVFEEKQVEHDLKVKQLRDPQSNAMSKKFTFLKSRAKKSLTSIESFWEKSVQKVQELQHEAEHHIQSPVERIKFFSDNSRSAPNTPISHQSSNSYQINQIHVNRNRHRSGSPASFTDTSPLAGSRVAKTIVQPEPLRPRSNTVGSPAEGSINVRRKLNMAERNDDASSSVNQSSMSSSSARSFSTPYLRRLGRLLPDVQESPAEDGSAGALKSVRNSFSRLFGGGKIEKPEKNLSVEIMDIKRAPNKPTVTFSPCNSDVEADLQDVAHLRKRSTHRKPKGILRHFEDFSSGASDVSSDEDDQGIYFVAKTKQAHHTLSPLCKPSVSSKTQARPVNTEATESEDIYQSESSGRRLSAFTKVMKSNVKSLDQPQEVSSILPQIHADHSDVAKTSYFESSDPANENGEEFPEKYGEFDCRNLGSLNTTPMQSRSSTPDATPEKSITASARKLSFHQKIFNKVTTPVRKKNPSSKDAGSPNIDDYKRPLSKTPDQIRLAWRRAIQDQMMLNRINKVSSTVETFEAEATPSDKLNYAEPDPCSEEMTALWEELLETDGRDRYKIDKQVLHSAVKKGVPMRMRGKVWSFLYEQWKLRDIDSRHTSLSTFRLPSPPYEKLLRQLTPHHHAILIDLSRTYPSSSYFSKQLGPGQLSLYNILKAYSMLDTEVGYCQGLSFVAGLLLLHYHTPNEAFLVLRHLMADMGCRKLYLPDMNTLRIAIYQLSRLLHDFHNDLYTHFEDNDVTLMLFSAPWFLTMFTSVLSFGFVARIFDILFMEGISALFKAALCLLCHHKENILKEKGFENIVKYLKDNLPNMADDEVKQVLNDMFQLDIGEKLRVYEVEYAVLEDGDIFGNDENSEEKGAGGDLDQKYMRLEQAHQTVTKYNLELVEQLEAAKMQIKSLQQGLTDMASIDERRALQLEQLRQENQLLTNSH